MIAATGVTSPVGSAGMKLMVPEASGFPPRETLPVTACRGSPSSEPQPTDARPMARTMGRKDEARTRMPEATSWVVMDDDNRWLGIVRGGGGDRRSPHLNHSGSAPLSALCRG